MLGGDGFSEGTGPCLFICTNFNLPASDMVGVGSPSGPGGRCLCLLIVKLDICQRRELSQLSLDHEYSATNFSTGSVKDRANQNVPDLCYV